MVELSKLDILSEPFELLDLMDQETTTIKVDKWQLGKTTMKTTEVPGGKEAAILRLFIAPEYKKTIPIYWDISSKTLIEGLMPYLEAPDFRKKLFKITKYGVAPRARFTLEVILEEV